MYIIRQIDDLHKIMKIGNSNNTSVGFVPTMGALHEGHLSLVRESKRDNDITIISIFVNPTQFNDKNDLAKYPRTLKEDIAKLDTEKPDILFLPDVIEIYPEVGFEVPPLQLDHLINKLDGLQRPGHFEGVVQVVYRFLDIVKPDRLYMGLKDYQQQRIIGAMIQQLKMSVALISLPTLREASGLAMSSRNKRLSEEERKRAATLYKVLENIKSALLGGGEFEKTKEIGVRYIEDAGMKVEYITAVDAESLEEVEKRRDMVVVLIAAWMGEVRLIDNIII